MALTFAACVMALIAIQPVTGATHDYCYPPPILVEAGEVYMGVYEVLAENGYLFRIQVWEESNGEPGFQYGEECPVPSGVSPLGDVDVCSSAMNCDTGII